MTQLKRKISIIIPTYNEEASIGQVIDRIRAVDPEKDWEIIVVNDGSTDQTAPVAKAHGVLVVTHPYNLGNGAAVKSGAKAAAGDILVMLDGDGQHPPEKIPELLSFIGEYDMVVGARTAQSDVSRFRTFGNTILNKTAQYLSKREIPDLTSGFRAIKKPCFDMYKHLFPQQYSYPTTITLSMLIGGYFVKYVPLDHICRRNTGVSHISPFKDGLRFLNIMLRIIVLFNPLKFFVPLSLIFFTLGSLSALYDAILHFRLEESSLLLLILSVFLLFFGIIANQVTLMRREMYTLFFDKPED